MPSENRFILFTALKMHISEFLFIDSWNTLWCWLNFYSSVLLAWFYLPVFVAQIYIFVFLQYESLQENSSLNTNKLGAK